MTSDAHRMRYAQSILDVVGDTPLVRLNQVTDGLAATVLAKVEYLNPGGSVKDRIATAMIDAAEKEGKLRPGGTIVEPTSGNTGVGLALVAQRRGYRCVFVCPDKVGQDKIDVLTAYGAEVVIAPTAVPPDHPESYYSVSDRLAEEIEGAFKPNQYENLNGPGSHYATTGPEVWRDTAGRVTHFVAGIGTGGTISGTGRYLKEASEGKVRVIGADPEGSVYSGGTGRPYLVEGVGEDIWPGAYDSSVPDEVVAVDDAASFAMTVRLAREEGLLVGGSSGMAVVAALRAARDLGPDDVVVVLLPDGGRGYLAKIFNDGWMARHGFAGSREHPSVRDLLATRGELGLGEPLPHVDRGTTVREAAGLMREHGLDRLLVLAAEPPVMLGEALGTVRREDLLAALAEERASGSTAVEELVTALPPLTGIDTPLTRVREDLVDEEALLVTEAGHPVALLTRADLLDHVLGGLQA